MASLNLGALSTATTAATTLSNLILVSPQKTVGYQPQNSPSWKRDTQPLPPSYIFNYEGENTATITAEITDHYVEDNTAVQDQIAIKPVIITTQGFVAELNDIPPAALALVQLAAQKLTVVGAYSPQLTATAILAYNEAFQLYQVGLNAVNSAVNSWDSINGNGGETVINGSNVQSSQPNQTQQQIAFLKFFGYWNNRQFFTIQTPWAIFQDMVIQNMRAIQDANTRTISEFEITFKQIRFASTQINVASQSSTLFDNNNMQGRAFNQGSSNTDLGTNALTTPSGTPSFSDTFTA